MERLDKRIASCSEYSRKDVRLLIKERRVKVSGEPALSFDQKIDENAEVEIDGIPLFKKRRIVAILNKPRGYVTSTDDPVSPTVMSLLPSQWKALSVYPVGRLDKETEGLLVFTNDGNLAHRLISPKSRVEKEYYAEHIGEAKEDDVEAFSLGIVLDDGEKCRPAILIPIEKGKSRIILTEGKYHQVRRMMASRGLGVTYLRRIREGGVKLGELPLGEWRELSEEEELSLEQY